MNRSEAQTRTVLALIGTLAILLVLAFLLVPAHAQTAIPVGEAGGDLLETYLSVLGTLVSAIISWALWRFLKIRQDAEARDAIEKFVTNAAGALLAGVRGKTDQIKIEVGSPQIADLATGALRRIPDALKHFGLGPQDLQRRIVEKVGVLTAPGSNEPGQ